MRRRSTTWHWIAAGLACLVWPAIQAQQLGYLELAQPDGGTTGVFYPTAAAETVVRRGPFDLSWAADAPLLPQALRLIVISHGSGGSAWVHVDLALLLVQRGFVVALPQHAGDNRDDDGKPGPPSWRQRPAEISRAIDAVLADARLSRHVLPTAVGVFGGSAGGHAALSMAGGQWSPARFRDHCRQHMAEDFSSCVGFLTRLRGNWLDGPKRWLAQRVIDARFSDETLHRHADTRVAAVVAMVPFAADFVPDSLAQPPVPLLLVIAERDVNQIPRFHAEAIARACEPRCEVIRLPTAGHGVMLSPLPPFAPGTIAFELLSDPPGFDRASELPALHERVAAFFARRLPAAP